MTPLHANERPTPASAVTNALSDFNKAILHAEERANKTISAAGLMSQQDALDTKCKLET